MNPSAPPPRQSTWKIPLAIGALALVCCLGFFTYLTALYISIDDDINILPPPTLDANCDDYQCLNACLRQLPDFEIAPLSEHERELAEKPGGYEIAYYDIDEETNTLEQIPLPTVPEYLTIHQSDTALHQRIWRYYVETFPSIGEIQISYLIVYMDASEDRYSASVLELEGKWRLYINLIEFDSPRAVISTLAHEYGHILTLNKYQSSNIPDQYGRNRDQADFDRMKSQCQDGRFFVGYECALPQSYLNEFGNRFWTAEIYEAWVKAFLIADDDPVAYESAITKLYEDHSDQFVSSYAANNPVEDIAESWTEFIMRPQPVGSSIADQKVLFFYDYPELVQTRAEILKQVCQFAIDQE